MSRLQPYLPRLYRYAFSLTRNEDAAKDLVQQCAVKALAARSVPEDEPAYRAWHSLRLVTQQGLSAPRWSEVLDYMVEEQEMPKLDAANRKLIVDYLAQFYGEDRKAKGGRRKRR